MNGDPEELDRTYNFPKRIREEKVIYDECDRLIATTVEQRDILDRDYDTARRKISVIPPGYDDNRFYPVSLATRETLKKELGLSGTIILALGRLATNKGYDLLIQAMPVVMERIEDARLILPICDDEMPEAAQEEFKKLQSLVDELGIGASVEFRNHVPDDVLADHYRAASVFALSSRYEPFGMTAVEAMACGTPTVITTEGGLWEDMVWGLEALYANPFDPPAFGHAICAVLQHPEVADQLALYGSQKARARFTWNGIAQQIINELQVLSRPTARRRPSRPAIRESACLESASLSAT